ncbi:MAG: hypothetical protein C0623_03350 [Desulfuromonas sp.]|nr:MAG: hypothetical protein C0623_03350 [Desulfuromonas sp.]
MGFELTEKLKRLDISAPNVLRLQRSLADLQIAIPGQKAQKATAYVCAFNTGKGVRVVVALHLKDEYKLIYYLNTEGEIHRDKASHVLNEGVNFSETLGFMMVDLDFHKMEGAEKVSFWESLPLKNPPKPPAEPKPAPPVNAKSVITDDDVIEEAEALSSEESIELDLGLPRSKLAGRIKKERPSPAEIEKKRARLRENLGRFLSSL